MKFRRRLVESTRRIVKDPERVRRLVRDADLKSTPLRDRLGDTYSGLQTLLRLLRAWAGGKYRRVPWPTLTRVVLGVFYFVWIPDAIPDFIPGVGYVDDLAVLGWILRSIHGELARFEEWEAGQ